jgi:hypothetical protein
VLLFFLHSVVEIHLTLAWIASMGAMLLMIIAGFKDIEEVLEHVEWSTLIFFAALFIMMEALDRLGLIEFLGLQVAAMIETVPDVGSNRLAAAVTVIVWVSGIGSAFIDNIVRRFSLFFMYFDLLCVAFHCRDDSGGDSAVASAARSAVGPPGVVAGIWSLFGRQRNSDWSLSQCGGSRTPGNSGTSCYLQQVFHPRIPHCNCVTGHSQCVFTYFPRCNPVVLRMFGDGDGFCRSEK